MYLFLDTETTGLPKNWKAPESDVDNWPRLVQIAWLQYDKKEKQIAKGSYIIKPADFIIPEEVVKIHGISNKRAEKEGVYAKNALNEFSLVLKNSKCLVAHKLNFDKKVIAAEFLRAGIENNLSEITKICTMESSTDFCQILGPYGYKWPTLSELHLRLFNFPYVELHNASSDVAACSKCFFELVKKGVIKLKL